MQALKLHLTVDDALVRVLPELAVLLGQHIELIALGEESKPSRNVPRAGALAGKIALRDDFDAPLPADMRRAFEGGRSSISNGLTWAGQRKRVG